MARTLPTGVQKCGTSLTKLLCKTHSWYRNFSGNSRRHPQNENACRCFSTTCLGKASLVKGVWGHSLRIDHTMANSVDDYSSQCHCLRCQCQKTLSSFSAMGHLRTLGCSSKSLLDVTIVRVALELLFWSSVTLLACTGWWEESGACEFSLISSISLETSR